MAPNGELLIPSPPSRKFEKPPQKAATPRISMEGLQRTFSDLSFELSKDAMEAKSLALLPPISEVEDATCECCGMSEECTPEYIRRVQEKFSGKWICGLCSEAVKEETQKNGGRRREALDAHVSVCARFNRIGRKNPVLLQAEAMKEILRKSSRVRAKSTSPRDNQRDQMVKMGSGIARSSSCIPALTKEIIKERN